MDEFKQFEITIRRRIPFVTNLIYALLIFFFAILFILYLIMLPTRNASGEMATAYYIVAVPESLKALSAYSVIGLLVVVPLYYAARLHKPARLKIHENHLTIEGKKIDVYISFPRISKVYCNDLHNFQREPKGILQFVIQKTDQSTTTFRLKFYEQGEEVLQALSHLKSTKFAFYDDDMPGDDEV